MKEQVEVGVSESIVERLQAARRRALEGLSEAELRDRIDGYRPFRKLVPAFLKKFFQHISFKGTFTTFTP